MSYVNFAKSELAAAITRGVRQCVVIASRPLLGEALGASGNPSVRVFAVGEDAVSHSSATFVPTQFAHETLATALEKSDFDKMKASLFIWLGGAGYRAIEGDLASLAFIASLPKGSGVVFDYVVERTSLELLTDTALDALASRLSLSNDCVKYMIQPQAVMAMLHSLGFRHIADRAGPELPMGDGHLVCALV